MNRSRLNSTTRRKGPGPTTYKPARTDPAQLNPPPPAAPPQKPWNYNVASKGPTAVALPEKPKGAAKAQKVQPKPEWDPFFWKTEAQLDNDSKQSKQSPRNESTGDIFEKYPKFLEIEPEPNLQPGVPPSWEVQPTSKISPTSSDLNLPAANSSSSDISQPKWNHKWWESFIRDVPASATKGRFGSGEPISEVKPKVTKLKGLSPPPVTVDADAFVLELADMSELVEFLLYKCAAEECLPMLPKVLKDLDTQFLALVTKYLGQKKEGVRGQDPGDISIFTEVSQLQKDLKAKNDEILKTNEGLLGEVENLKSQVNILQDLIGKQEQIEGELRSKVKSLETLKVERTPAGSPLPPRVTFDMIQLKAENEALKMMNTKLRTESEMSNRIVGMFELNNLCQTYRNQEEVKGGDQQGRKVTALKQSEASISRK